MPTEPYIWSLLSIATLAAFGGVIGGVFISETKSRLRFAIPISAGVLLGVALFGLLPEVAHDLSWIRGVGLFVLGYGALALLERAGVQICPACGDEHGHHHCAAPLHGFATPLLIAAGIHSVFDGWALAATGGSVPGVRYALPLAIVLHKAPEGLALGGILEASIRSRFAATALAMLVESLTLFGGGASIHFAPSVGSSWTSYPLGVAGGFFVFLAYHALLEEWKRSRRHRVRV